MACKVAKLATKFERVTLGGLDQFHRLHNSYSIDIFLLFSGRLFLAGHNEEFSILVDIWPHLDSKHG